MKLIILSVLASLLWAVSAFPEPGDSLAPEATARVPAVRVPLGKSPALDGRIVKGDYGPATTLQDLVVVAGEDKGVAGRYPTKVILTYNQRAFYVGFRTEMPEGARPKITVTEGHDTGFPDDAFEIFLTVGDNNGEQFHLGGNAAGVTWDRNLGKSQDDWGNWNPKVTYATYVEEGGWGGEFEIPWSEMGVEFPKGGDIWRANFYANRATPEKQLEAWSYVNKWREFKNNGRLIFGSSDLPYFSFYGSWKDAWQTHTRGMFLPIQTPRGKDDPRKVQVLMQLLRRETDPSHEGSYYTEFEDRRKEATKEGGTLATFEQDLTDELKTFTPIEDHAFTKDLPDPDFTVGWGPTYRIDKAGDYLVRYHFKDVTDPARPFVLAGGALPFRVRTGVQTSVTPYLLTRQSVVLTADLRAIADLGSVAQLRAYITEEGKDKPVSEATQVCTGQPKQDVEVSVKGLPVDRKYQAHVQVVDKSGKVASTAWAPFTRPPDPDWWINRNKYGSQPEVPQPWTPIRFRNADFGFRNVAEVWGRKIAFGDSVLPQQITNQGQSLLAKPMELQLTTGGKLQPWRKKTMKATEVLPGHLRLESSQEAAGARVRGVNVFEFDGFSLIDLTIEPVAGKASIDKLDLLLPVKAQYAQFLTNYHYAPGPGPQTDMFNQKRYVGRMLDHYHSPVMLTTWLGTDDLGLEWSAESSKGWSLSAPEKAIEVNRKGEVVEARFHFIDQPMTLDKPRQIRFGLIATPTKPVPPERFNWRIDFASGPPPIPEKTKVEKAQYDNTLVVATQEHLDNYWKDRSPVDINVALLPGDWSGQMVWHPKVTNPELAEILREQEKLLKEHGKWVLRNGGWAVAPYATDWDPWGKEMVALPKVPTFANQLNHSYASPFVEFFVGSWTMHARELGVRGIRFDTVFPWSESANQYLGETWQADDGKTYGTQSLFREREMAKRLYRIFNGGELKDGVIYHPLAGPPIMAVESFVDIHEVGEGYYMHADSLKKGYVQDAVRVWMTGKPYGFVAVNNIKGGPLTPNHRIGALLAAGAYPRIFLRSQIDIKSYDTKEWYMPTSALWAAWSWIDRATAQWHPHWTNKDKISTQAEGEHYVSFHLQPGRRILLVATNYEKQEMGITVKLNRAKLGFKPDVKLEAVDAITGQTVEVAEGDTMRLIVGPELYRYVKIGPRSELVGPNLDSKHPALAGSG